MANANVFRSNIKLINNTIEGGSFFLENVEKFEFSQARIHNIQNKDLSQTFIKLVNVQQAVFHSNNTIKNSTLNTFIYADNSYVNIENLNLERSMLETVIITKNSSIDVKNLYLSNTNILHPCFNLIGTSFHANKIKLVDCILKHRLFNALELYTTIKRFELQNTTVDDLLFFIEKSNVNANEIQVIGCILKKHPFYVKYSDNITIQKVLLQETTVSNTMTAFYVEKSNFNAKEIQILDCTCTGRVFNAIVSNNIKIQRFLLQHTKVDEHVFAIW